MHALAEELVVGAPLHGEHVLDILGLACIGWMNCMNIYWLNKLMRINMSNVTKFTPILILLLS